MKRIVRTLPLVAVLALAACSSTSSSPASDPAPEVPALSDEEIAELAVEVTWGGLTRSEQADLCLGYTLFGSAWSQDAFDNDELWPYLETILEEDC